MDVCKWAGIARKAENRIKNPECPRIRIKIRIGRREGGQARGSYNMK